MNTTTYSRIPTLAAANQGLTVDESKNLLIEYVKDNPVLWDSNHMQYKDFELKQMLWEEFANRLVAKGYPCAAEDLPKQWKNLVDYYRHLKKKSHFGNKVKWLHYQAMCFLDHDTSSATDRPKSRSSPPIVDDGPPMKIAKREELLEEEEDSPSPIISDEHNGMMPMVSMQDIDVGGHQLQPMNDPIIEDVLGLVPMLRRLRNCSVNAYDNMIVEMHTEVLKALRKSRAENKFQ